MHLLIPFSFCHHEAAQHTLRAVKLPHLEQLLARLQAQPGDGGNEHSLSAPHERARARALGLPTADGLIPWAAWYRRQHEALALATDDSAGSGWAFLSPCHWQVGMDRLTMSGPELPDLSEAESRALLATVQPYLIEDGLTLHYDQPTRWLAHGRLLRDLPSASLDRVLGQSLIEWMPRVAALADWRRLQNELQMLLYEHPVNEARQARGAQLINSFWLSGTGHLPTERTPAPEPGPLQVIETLRTPALAQDWAAWAQAWQAVDAQACAQLLSQLQAGGSATLTLCGLRQAQRWQAPPPSWLTRLRQLFHPRSTLLPLEQL